MANGKGIDLGSYKRNRCIGWLTPEVVKRAEAAGLRGFEPGKGLYSDSFYADDGKTILEPLLAFFNVDRDTARPIIVADLPEAYSKGPREALAQLASEWKMDAETIVWDLVLNARLQDEANDAVKRHRPVSDKAKDRARTVVIKSLMAQHGLSETEVEQRFSAVLSALA